MSFSNGLCRMQKPMSTAKRIVNTLLLLMSGAGLGIFSKVLDTPLSNELPTIHKYLKYADISNFLGRFAIWLLLGICICFYSNSYLRAAVNVFVFFLGMVSGYYMYTKIVLGFFPKSYALIWFVFTAISPFLSLICRLAKGKGKLSAVTCAVVIAVLFNTVFVYGMFYFQPRSVPEAAVFCIGLTVLRRDTFKETAAVTALGVGIAFMLNLLLPFHFG